MDQTRVSQIVKPTLTKDLGSSLEPDRFPKLDTVTGQELGEHTPKSPEHGPSAVDDLKLAVLGECLWVSGEPSSVPTVVTWEFPGEVRWGLTGEWAQVLNTVGTVPWAPRWRHFLNRGFPHGNFSISIDV
ncbi:hypothetical protein HanRHA438_Chr17g0832791 [Helianthus annuus]|nr:hypothetical protein HanHA300_Chr17g0670251 [Helianthus annuus]KAJ0448973.1 hypothetical protein HanHA89_Chr17g0723101 [Helianthus annuus]KAJ0828052.1 hypothetical protein HanRHA438_Chr17g0832791 [Helianthus annuus]